MKIEIVSDVSKVVADTAKLADNYDDVSDALKDLARDGEKAGEKIEKAFKDGVGDRLEKSLEEAGDEAKKLERKADSAFDSISNDARKAGRDVGKSQKEGFKEAGEGLSEFKDEANSTAKESAASFDGSAESIADVFQEVAANAFAGFGPAGAAAGLAVAVGMGIAITAMQDTAEKATAMKQRAVDMIDGIKEAGGDLADMDLADKIIGWGREVIEDNWITFWADESSTNFQEIAKHAKTMGINVSDAIRAAAGSAEDSRKLLDATAQTYQDLNREIEKGTSANEDGMIVLDASAEAAKRKRDALDQLRGKAEENIKVTGDAVDIYNIETDALKGTEEAAKRAADAVKEKADASAEAAGAAMDLTTAETEYAEKLPQLNEDIKKNGKNLDINTAAGRANRDSLVDLAKTQTSLRDAAIGAGEGVEQVTARVQVSRDAFINAAIAAGHNEDSARALADSYGLIPGNVETLVKANGTEEVKAQIEGIPEAKDATVTTTETGAAEAGAKIDAAATDKEATITTTDAGTADTTQARIEGIQGKDVKVDVQDFNTVQQTQDRINGLQGKDVGVRLYISNEFEFAAQVGRLTAPKTQYVNLVPREGAPATP